MAYLPDGLPLPDTNEIDTKDWWAACQRKELVVQQCTDCGTFRHPPMPICHNCHSFAFRWTPVSGRGVVHSFIVPHHPVHPALKGAKPYNVVVVELPDAQVRMVGNVIDTPNDQVRIGMDVQVAWEAREGVILPQWKKV
ncbi:MAG: OB-fold domain-containing protein [Chloroflexi bacterium]|nr:OB-fold domain-containing protein [Chloroflexota bacterium]